MRTHTALQHMARLKATAGNVLDTTGVKFNRVLQISQKPAPLTEAEVAILEHFVHSNNSVLNNTVYMGDEIIYPVTKPANSYYKQAATGQFVERAKGTGPIRPKSSNKNKPTGKKRGRPRLSPPKVTIYIED